MPFAIPNTTILSDFPRWFNFPRSLIARHLLRKAQEVSATIRRGNAQSKLKFDTTSLLRHISVDSCDKWDAIDKFMISVVVALSSRSNYAWLFAAVSSNHLRWEGPAQQAEIVWINHLVISNTAICSQEHSLLVYELHLAVFHMFYTCPGYPLSS